MSFWELFFQKRSSYNTVPLDNLVARLNSLGTGSSQCGAHRERCDSDGEEGDLHLDGEGGMYERISGNFYAGEISEDYVGGE